MRKILTNILRVSQRRKMMKVINEIETAACRLHFKKVKKKNYPFGLKNMFMGL